MYDEACGYVKHCIVEIRFIQPAVSAVVDPQDVSTVNQRHEPFPEYMSIGLVS